MDKKSKRLKHVRKKKTEDQPDTSETAEDWGSLPEVCLLHIFGFLEDKDRRSADLTCRHWHSVMRSPSLWRSRSFLFTGHRTIYKLSECCSAVAYAKSLGRYLWTMEVFVKLPRKSTVTRRIEEAVSALLSELTRVGALVRSISVLMLELDQPPWTSSLRASLVSSLIAFFQIGGSRLTSVNLYGMRNNLAHGLAVLSALDHAQKHSSPWGSISNLDLRGFFSSSVDVSANPQVPSILGQLRSITSLHLNYSYLSDELLTALQHVPQAQGVSGDGKPLQWLYLDCCSEGHHQQKLVSGSSWRALVSTCPELKVRLKLHQITDTNWLTRILLPQIPMTEFLITAFTSSPGGWNARPLLQDLLPQYRHSLQRLDLYLNDHDESVNEQLLELVMQCEHLQELTVWAHLHIPTVEKLLNIRLKKRVLLNKITMKILSRIRDIGELEEQLEQVTSSFQLPPELELNATVHPFG
ncbi:F-box only protein 39-like [Halichoeres trimaculatus]|uniref:F-box only protein 39-like n=1 Tax=Halichoeres trimaculatus TaxID=147232 RepID=UPI003D9DC26C